jgi:predicted AlkP superfamily phosphohydrolase/phosphomutase
VTAILSRNSPLRSKSGAVLALFLTLAGCARQTKPIDKKIIVLGIDAMDAGFLERHWDSLPNLDRLRRTGEFRRMATTVPPQSPVAWSTFITGMDPGGHGIFDFVHRDPATMQPLSSMAELIPPASTLRLGPYALPLSGGGVKRALHGTAFWQLLDEAGVPVTLLRMPNNFPPLESKAQTLSGMGAPDMRGTFGTFTDFDDDPRAVARDVAGGRIVPVTLERNRVALVIEGPENTLRRDRARSTVTMDVQRDPDRDVAQFEVEGQRFLLKQGEWSGWIRVRFPVVPWLKSAAGMFRVYAKKLNPEFRIYVSPVNLDPAAPELPISTPPAYSRELAEAIGPFYTQGIAEDTAALRAGVLTREEYLAQSRSVGDEQFRMLEYALSRFHQGVLFLHFLGIDQDSHVLWGTHEAELLKTYQRVDAEVGRVMRAAPEATLLVMSDHGFATFHRAVNLNTWLYREGFLALDNPSNLGQGEMFAHVDWSRTRAYGLGLNGLYLNLAGRERKGIVDPGDREKLVDELVTRLEALRDPADGQRVVARAYRTRDIYHGAALTTAPEIVVGWADGFRSSWKTALGALSPNTFEDNNDEWRGDHCIAAELVPATLLSNRKSKVGDIWLGDLTVTLLHEFGVSPAAGMRGRAIF